MSLNDNDYDNILAGGMVWPDSKSGAADQMPVGMVTAGFLPSGPTASASSVASVSSSGNTPTTWIYDAYGNRIAVTPGTPSVPMGNTTLQMDGSKAVFSPGLLPQGATDPQDRTRQYNNEDELVHTYAGSDMRVLIEVPSPPGGAPGPAKRKQLIELTTISISVHRVKSPVRSCGYINPRGFARGGRTIAGTIILTQFTVDVMYRFLYDAMVSQDLSKDSFYLKPDQLPPFDMTLLFSDEYGNASHRRLLGVDCATDGTVYSINDLFTEQTISYYAADFTPLLPMNRTTLMAPASNTAADVQKTPMQVMPKERDLTPSVDSSISYGGTPDDLTHPALNSGFEGVM